MARDSVTIQAGFSCISWNIHRCRGKDGRVDPDRILSVLASEVWSDGLDALILQEADEEDRPHAGLLDIAAIEAVTGLRYAHTSPERRWSPESHGFLGVILFLHPDYRIETMRLLDLPGRYHRGAVVADVERGGAGLRVIATHLSLSQALRWAQLRTVSQHMTRLPPRPTILVGDLNEWRPWGGMALSPRLLGHRFEGPAKPTFPVTRPVLPLDRVLVTPPAEVRSTRVLDGPGIRMASDHRPLLAQVALPA